jgi:hypothetical protein
MASTQSTLEDDYPAPTTPTTEKKKMTTRKRTFTLNFLGDVMIGRLIDQLFPQHVPNTEEARIISSFRNRYPHLLELQQYTPSSPWGTTLPLLWQSDLNLINLETAVTTHDVPWPHKAFNYRCHPTNAAAILSHARVDFAALANNHTLDFGPEGLVETVWTLKRERIGFAGAGETTEEAISPTILSLPRGKRGTREGGQREDPASTSTSAGGESSGGSGGSGESGEEKNEGQVHAIHIWSASDHPRDWAVVPTFHLIDYSPQTRSRLKRLLTSRPRPEAHTASTVPSLRIFSVHWGPNYSFHPPTEIRSLARFLIDECEVDVVHGHSSHHVQGVERPRPGKLIIYGCGDFVDDYALNERFRNDLGAVWRVVVREEEDEDEITDGETEGERSATTTSNKKLKLRPSRLEFFPVRIQHFQTHLLDRSDPDHAWLRARFTEMTRELMMETEMTPKTEIIRKELGEEGQVIVDLE